MRHAGGGVELMGAFFPSARCAAEDEKPTTVEGSAVDAMALPEVSEKIMKRSYQLLRGACMNRKRVQHSYAVRRLTTNTMCVRASSSLTERKTGANCSGMRPSNRLLRRCSTVTNPLLAARRACSAKGWRLIRY